MTTPSTYSRLNRGASRIMFTAGLGLAAVILGSILSVGLSMRLAPRVIGWPQPLLLLLDAALRYFWCLAVLPLLTFGASRVMALRPWMTALGTLSSGSLFLLMLSYLQRGAGGVWRGTWDFVTWLMVMVVSTVLVRRAILQGARSREAQETRAQAQAAAKVSEYEAFRAEAEALGARHEARAATPARDGDGADAAGDGQGPAKEDGVEEPSSTEAAASVAAEPPESGRQSG